MLYYLLLLFSFGLLLAGFRHQAIHTGMTKKKRFRIAVIITLYSCYSLFYIFSDYISGNGIDDAAFYFLRDIFYGGGGEVYGKLLFLIILIFIISFVVVNGLLRKSVSPSEGSTKQKLVFYLLIIFSFILNPTTLGLINYTLNKKTETCSSANPKKNRYDVNRFIAHAGGEIDGYTYTNSLEALNQNYEKGFRIFELDINETSDHKYVAVHEWKQWKQMTGFEGKLPPSLEKFKQYRILGKYRPLEMDDINAWFKNHPDAILVTDKINDPAGFSQSFIDKDRLMMELFTMEALKEALNTGIRSAMPNWSLLSEIKGDKAKILAGMGVTDITVSRRNIKYNIPLLKKLKKEGIHVYVYHVNYDKGKDENYVLCYDMDFIYGLYADKFDFRSLSQTSPSPDPH